MCYILLLSSPFNATCQGDNIESGKASVFEGSIIANYISILYGKKMPTDIVALEDSDVLVVPASLMRERIIQDPTLHIRFANALFEQAYEHVLNDYRSTPEQRFKQLFERYPRLFRQ